MFLSRSPVRKPTICGSERYWTQTHTKLPAEYFELKGWPSTRAIRCLE
jgi:hypothetical protein